VVVAVLALGGCGLTDSGGGPSGGGDMAGAALMRGFSVEVDEAISDRVPLVHLKTCGAWGCHEQDVPLAVSGPMRTGPCPSGPDGQGDAPADSPADSACGAEVLPGPGPGHGYAPVPDLTGDPVTVTVSTPSGAPFPIAAEVRVEPRLVCSGSADSTCSAGTPQARLRIAPDATVTAV
jgi:hypothetical protein